MASFIKPGLENRLEFVLTDNTHSADNLIFNPFPSVTRGPISIEKIKTVLGFTPVVSMSELFRECVEFYRQAYVRFPKMRQQVEKEVKKDLNIKSNIDKENFEKFIKNYQV